MKKIIITAAAVLMSVLMLGSCAQSKEEQKPAEVSSVQRLQIELPEKRDTADYESVLKIDGVEVPFLQGEEEIKSKLGESFSEWIHYEFPEGVDGSKPVLVMPYLDNEQDICEISTYSFNYTEGNPMGHDLDLFGIDGLYIPIPILQEHLKDNLITLDENNYELIYVNGGYVKTPADVDAYTKELDTMLLIDRSIDSYMVIDMIKSPENTADLITFTVINRAENYDKIEA